MSNAANLYAFGSALNHAPTGTLMRGAVPFATVNAVFWQGHCAGPGRVCRVAVAGPARRRPLCARPRFYIISRCSFSPSACASAICCPRWKLAALCALCTRRRGYALLAGGLAATTLFNQFLVLHYVHGAPLSFRQALGQNLRPGRRGQPGAVVRGGRAGAVARRAAHLAGRACAGPRAAEKSGKKRGNSTLFLLYCISVEICPARARRAGCARLSRGRQGKERMNEMVLVVDFGGQYNQLIARRVRESHVYSEIVSYKKAFEAIREKQPRGIILTGGPNSVYSARFAHHRQRAVQPGRACAGHLLWRAADDACAGRPGVPRARARIRQNAGARLTRPPRSCLRACRPTPCAG